MKVDWKVLSKSSRLKSLIFLAFGVFGLNFGLATYQSTYTNFLVSDLKIDAFQMGVLESIRELPGLLSAFILGSILHFSQPLLAGISILIFGLGLAGISTVSSWIHVVLWAIVWSIGFHCWHPLQSALTIDLADQNKEGKRLGQMNSVASVASIVAMASIAALSSFIVFQYRLFFIAAGLISIIGGTLVFKIKAGAKILKKTRFVFRGRYKIYYTLSFLEGARRQIFFTFSPLVLVKIFGLDVTIIAFTMSISQLLIFVSSPYVGKLIDKVGPRTILTINYILMIVDFLGYTYIRNIFILLALYVLSGILMVVSIISLAAYINKISPITDLTPSLAMGQTIEHIAAVILPLIGGVLWSIFGYEATFLIGATVVTCLLLTAQKIRIHKSDFQPHYK